MKKTSDPIDGKEDRTIVGSEFIEEMFSDDRDLSLAISGVIFWKKVIEKKGVITLVPCDSDDKQMFRHPTVKIILEKP
jgi:hypothetical protein